MREIALIEGFGGSGLGAGGAIVVDIEDSSTTRLCSRMLALYYARVSQIFRVSY
jgi:hypothetical protein